MELDSLLSEDMDFVYGELQNDNPPKEPVVEEVESKELVKETEAPVVEPVVEEVIDDEVGDDSPNLAYLNLLTERGIMNALDEETLTEFKSLGFEEQTNKLIELHDTAILDKASAMLGEYLSERPSKLKLIEENYKNGMSEDDAIKFALEAPVVYNPTFDTERDEAFEKKLILDEYLKMVGGDIAKAEILYSFDYEKGITKDRAIEISKAKNDNWNKAQQEHLALLEQNSAKQLEIYNESKKKYSEFLKVTEEILPNLKISKEDKAKIYEARFKPIQTAQGITTALDEKININPEKANAIMSYLFVNLDILNKPENIEKLYKIGKTAQTKTVIDTWKNTNVGATSKSVTRTAQPKSLHEYKFE